jgi:hypothetical protein
MVYQYKKNADGMFVCHQCGATKKNQNTMHYHLKSHEGKLPFECNICKKQFLQASTLDLHKRAQHTEHQDRLLRCPVPSCPYEGTLTKANLQIHFIRKHCGTEAAAARKECCTLPTCTHCDKECKSLTAFHYHIANCIQLDSAREAQLKTIQAY